MVEQDEINRMFSHGIHEDRVFHDRLNYFSILELGLLGVYAAIYSKEPQLGFFIPLTLFALIFSLIWLWIQIDDLRYLEHIEHRLQQIAPEFKTTVETFTSTKWLDRISGIKLLAWSVPILFAGIWIAFFIWLIVRPSTTPSSKSSHNGAILLVKDLHDCTLSVGKLKCHYVKK